MRVTTAMKSISTRAVTAAALLLATALPVAAQVTDYRQIATPPLRNFTPAQPKRIALPNGMVIFLQEDKELPLIRGSAIIRGGERNVPAAKAGLVDIYSDAWRTGGTKTRSGDQLDEFLESRAAVVETAGDIDSTAVTLNVLKADFDTVFPIFVDVLRNPEFRQDKIDLAKTQIRTAISRRNDDPSGILDREAEKLGYGPQSPYARQPEYDTVAAITRDDLLAFHKQFVHPNNIIIGFVGDFDSAALERKLRSTFASWARGPQAPQPALTTSPAKPGAYYIAKDDVTQSNIAVVHAGGPLRRDPDYYAIEVMNQVLSGVFSGRLMNRIRTEAGLAYSVYGGLDAGWDHPGLFTVTTGTKSETTAQAIDLVKDEVAKLKNQPFTAEELKHAKDAILNGFVFTMDSKAKILNQQLQLEFYGYPANYWQKYQQGIQSVTAADVERVAKKYVHPEQLAIVVVGNAANFDRPLSSFGTVTNVDVTIPEPGASSKPAPAAGAAAVPAASTPEALAVVQKVETYLGGKAKIDSIKSLRSVSARTMKTPQGDLDVEAETLIVYPGNVRQVMKTPMGEMTSVITPTSGFAITPMGTQDIPASQRGEVKLDVVSIVKNANSPGYVFTVAGTEKVGGVDTQVLSINADGISTKWFVDASGKILRTQRQGRMGEQITDYTAWQSFDGLNQPSAFTLTINGEAAGGGQVKSVEINPATDPKMFEKP